MLTHLRHRRWLAAAGESAGTSRACPRTGLWFKGDHNRLLRRAGGRRRGRAARPV